MKFFHRARLPVAAAAVALLALAAPARAQSFYVLDLRPFYLNCFNGCSTGGLTDQQLLDNQDLAVLAVGLQGLVNRTGPQLYIYATPADVYWLQQAQSSNSWGWAAGLKAVPINQSTDTAAQVVTELLSTFGSAVTGSVRWTAATPSTLNVATTVAGVDGLAIVREGSTFESQITGTFPIQQDLVGLFSDKIAAAQWVRTNYLETGLTTGGLLGYQLDGWPWTTLVSGGTPIAPYIYSRDYLVSQKAFLFDLSPWGTTEPVDDPTEPLGADLQEFQTILSDAQAQAPYDGITSIWGFIPWYAKYSDSTHGGVACEWETAQLTSSYDARVTGGGGQNYGLEMANASFHQWGSAALPHHMPRNASYTPSQLTALGYIDQYLVNPGFEWGTAGPWTLGTTNRAIYDNPSAAASGSYYLEVNVNTTGQSLYQDTTVAPAPGDVWQLTVSYQIHGQGSANLVLWALGANGAANLPYQLTLSAASVTCMTRYPPSPRSSKPIGRAARR